jgi:hypothetical protein
MRIACVACVCLALAVSHPPVLAQGAPAQPFIAPPVSPLVINRLADVPPTPARAGPRLTCSPVRPEMPRSIVRDPAFTTAEVKARVLLRAPDAEVISVEIHTSSGYPVLDESVLVAMRGMRCTATEPLTANITATQSFVFKVE